MIFAVLAKKGGDVRTQRDYAKMTGAGEIERGARELCGHPLAFNRRRHFCVVQHDAIRKEAVGKERTKPVHGGFEAVSLFVVSDCDGVEV